LRVTQAVKVALATPWQVGMLGGKTLMTHKALIFAESAKQL